MSRWGSRATARGNATYLHVCCLSLLDGLVELVARLHLACEVLVQAAQALRQAREVLLCLGLLFLVAQNGAVELLALLPQVLDACE